LHLTLNTLTLLACSRLFIPVGPTLISVLDQLIELPGEILGALTSDTLRSWLLFVKLLDESVDVVPSSEQVLAKPNLAPRIGFAGRSVDALVHALRADAGGSALLVGPGPTVAEVWACAVHDTRNFLGRHWPVMCRALKLDVATMS
jgi:hypothetical protein